MNELRIYLLGMPRIDYQGRTVKIARRKAMALAAYLALADHRQSRDVAADLLWPDLDRNHGLSALRSALHSLTTAIAFEWIDADRATLILKKDAVWVDVHAFTALLSATDTHGHHRETICDQCVTSYKQAIALYRSDFMAGFSLPDSIAYDDWQRSQREWLRREFADIQRRLSIYYAEAQDYAEAIKYAQQWLSCDPLHEPAHRQLIRLFAVNLQRSEAVRQYNQCVEILDRELATPPENETTELYEAIQSNQLDGILPTRPTVSGSRSILPPRPSLVIGRETVLHDIKYRLGIGATHTRPTTIIQGWPGVGKSTTVATLAHDSDIALQFPDGVLWTSLGETPSVNNEIVAWAAALGIHEPSRSRSIEDISAQITAALRDRRMLLIVDDVWRVEHAVPFRVGGEGCAMIITSRLNDVAAALAPTASDIYHLPILTEESGLELLAQVAPEIVAE
jgi:DNA-binding SARP family transcriptional activator